MVPSRAFVAPWCIVTLVALALALGVQGEVLSLRAKGGRERRKQAEILNENDHDKRFINDEEDLETYKKVKDTLRKFLEEGVDPEYAESEEEFKDYLEPDFEPLSRIVSQRLEFPEDTVSLRNSPTRRRGLVQEEEDHLDAAGSLNKRRLANVHGGKEHTQAFLNEWVVHMTGGRELAQTVARDLGYKFLGQVGDLKDIYRVVKTDHPATHKRDAPVLTHHLNSHAEVLWAEQQFIKERSKRMAEPETDVNDPYAPLVRVRRISDLEEGGQRREKRSKMASDAIALEKMFNDRLWPHQWYLFDTRTRPDLPKLDLQVVPVWKKGITGKGIRVLVLDDGLEHTHKDIINNYDSETSYDLNDDDSDPTPRDDGHYTNSHGTRCAGEIAMEPNNFLCGVGVAHGAKVGGVRMLDGPVSDAVEGAALARALDKVDIMTCSWGPTDDGKRVEGPGKLAQLAIENGIKEGRQGKGTVYVWAAGNGGSVGDNCNCDGYTSSIYTLSISSASESGMFPWYGERCASTLASAYSSGAYTDQKIATTDLHNGCTESFSGTSAAAPLAAGIFALVLEVNPALTWRDMQHAVVWTSEYGPLSHNSGWKTNGCGLRVNSRFGFGLLNADALVNITKTWVNVPEQITCKFEPSQSSGTKLTSGEATLTSFTVDEDCAITSLEHVQVIATISYSRRGALAIDLTSPMGTETALLSPRVGDSSKKGFSDWAFMSVHTWCEDPKGEWKLNISDSTDNKEKGTIDKLELVLHGTSKKPEHMKEKRVYKLELRESEEEMGEDQMYLTADQLRSLSWEQLVALLTQSTRSTFSDADIRMLLEEDRLEEALRNIQSEDGEFETRKSSRFDWTAILRELMARK